MPQFIRATLLIAAVAAVVCLATAGAASAQTNSLFGSRGPASQIGSNLRGSTVGSGSGFGSGFGMTGSGSTFSPTGQMVGGALGGNTSGGALGTTTGTGVGQGGFVGRDDNAGRFVGDQRLGQQGGIGQQGRFGRQSGARQFGNRGGGGNTGRAFGGGNPFGGANQRAARVIRPRQEVAFSYARPTATAIARSVNTRFTRIALRQAALRDVTVVVDEEGVATLTGEVASAESQRLAAIMVRLEPGVRSVVNELTVAGGGE